MLWQFQTGAPVYASPSISGNQQLIVGSNDHFVYALDLMTGREIWKQNLGERIYSKPYVEPDGIYLGVASGYFMALHPKDGKTLWRFKTDQKIQYDACADDEGIFFGSDDSGFRKVSRQGKLIWNFKSTHRFWGTCAVQGDLLFTGSWDTNFYALNRKTGEVVWKLSSGEFNYGGPLLNGDDVYFSSHKLLLRIRAKTGEILSRIETPGEQYWPVVNDGFLWTTDQGLTKRSLDGQPLATMELSGGDLFHPVIGNGFLILANFNRLRAVSTDMKVLWEYKADDDFWSPGVLQDHVYYTGNRNGSVYALRLPN